MIQKSIVQLNYIKRKNTTLFEQFRNIVNFETIQNYSPIYTKLFELTEKNYNSFNLNHPLHIKEINANDADDVSILMDEDNNEITKPVYFKLAPILDPFKFFIGKYKSDIQDLQLPVFIKEDEEHEWTDIQSKIYDANNSAYIDGYFSYLSSQVLHHYGFVHGLDFYGSFVGIKKDLKINVLDDIEYLCKSEYFNEHNGTTFTVDNYEKNMINDLFHKRLPPIQIDHSKRENISANSIKDDLFEDIFEKDETNETDETLIELEEISDEKLQPTEHASSLNSNSTCSSRTSFTSSGSADEEGSEGEETGSEGEGSEGEGSEGEGTGSEEEGSDTESSEGSYDEEPIYATIPKFPVNIICMEKCVDTLDNLILTDGLQTDEEWLSALMQIIMTLIVYQKCFSFTHNDLHTNNIMYISTEIKFLYYCYNNKYYKVPTFGRIFKIIDFGRSIYKMNNNLFCSDSFKKGEDAATQYNMEPYLNENKPRIDPNYSFDLCRLGCSIFDYIVDSMSEVKNLKKCDPVVRIIVEWCLDDNGLNVLYKSDGSERYEEFKLYKMIARSVHKHTPQNQLSRSEFKQFCVDKKKIPKQELTNIMNIDLMNAC